MATFQSQTCVGVVFLFGGISALCYASPIFTEERSMEHWFSGTTNYGASKNCGPELAEEIRNMCSLPVRKQSPIGPAFPEFSNKRSSTRDGRWTKDFVQRTLARRPRMTSSFESRYGLCCRTTCLIADISVENYYCPT